MASSCGLGIPRRTSIYHRLNVIVVVAVEVAKDLRRVVLEMELMTTLPARVTDCSPLVKPAMARLSDQGGSQTMNPNRILA